MPNIEIHGVTDDLSYGQLYRRVADCLQDIPNPDEIVISGARDEVLDLKFQKQPYLRVLWTPDTTPGELDDIERRLDALDIDMEFLPLTKFVERRSVRMKKESGGFDKGMETH